MAIIEIYPGVIVIPIYPKKKHYKQIAEGDCVNSATQLEGVHKKAQAYTSFPVVHH